MALSTQTALEVASRTPEGSREARRLRRKGFVLGVVYGGGEEPLAFKIDARTLRLALAHAGAVLDLIVDGAKGNPVVLKELVRHPVNGETVHVDLLRVRLDRAIQATVTLELSGAEDSPGIRDGGVLEHSTRELTIEALPGDIPDSIQHDVSEMNIGDTLTLESIVAPANVTLVDDPEIVIATLSAPRLQTEDSEEIESETAVIGEAEGGGQAEDTQGESAGGSDGDGE
jgi:large subunit ribosomal protein L25